LNYIGLHFATAAA